MKSWISRVYASVVAAVVIATVSGSAYALHSTLNKASVATYAPTSITITEDKPLAPSSVSNPTANSSVPINSAPKAGKVLAQKTDQLSDIISFFNERSIVLSLQPKVTMPYAKWQSLSAESNDVYRSALVLKEEFSKYDKGFLKAAGLKNIYLVGQLQVSNQFRAGMPEPHLEQALYFDVSPKYTNSENGKYIRRVFHHELNHLIEHVQFGSYAPTKSQWTACNPTSFTYGDGGASMYTDPDYAHKLHPIAGFVNGYATSGQEEDMAEVFAEYMTSPDELYKLSQDDKHIACKATKTIELLQSIR